MAAISPDDKVVLVSVDGHMGPNPEHLRPYCPEKLRGEFDEYMKMASRPTPDDYFSTNPPRYQLEVKDRWTGPEHNNIDYRLEQMDLDGVALEITFAGSVNNNPMPFAHRFNPRKGDDSIKSEGQVEIKIDPKTEAAGLHIYNEWLADAISIAPERFIGCAQLPMWDVELATAEAKWAAKAGLRGLNFPGAREGILSYDREEWEPFWTVAEDNGMLLATHGGNAGAFTQLLNDRALFQWYVMIEAGGESNRAGIHRMIFGGVFERHPGLNIMFTEQSGNWWTSTGMVLDSLHRSAYTKMKEWNFCVDKKPTEYMAEHVYIGASMMAPFEADTAILEGYGDNMAWGRDFPHPEGTWGGQPYRGEDEERMCHLQLRHGMSHLSAEHIKGMAGYNAIRACRIDPEPLEKVTQTINAPTYAQVQTPLETIPAMQVDQPLDSGELVGGMHSFRLVGTWG